ncbi:MAG: hypothetical protein KDI30_01375 [Pseudomonadales bacterium]|nr:hypothetical protein [Pseudomonadales bacterium]
MEKIADRIEESAEGNKENSAIHPFIHSSIHWSNFKALYFYLLAEYEMVMSISG